MSSDDLGLRVDDEKRNSALSEETQNFPGTFPGTIKGPLDLPSIAEAADLVCEGQVIRIFEAERIQYLVNGAPTLFSRLVARFEIWRTFKGHTKNNQIEIEFLRADFPTSLEDLSEREQALVFLIESNAHYQFANLTTSKSVIEPEIGSKSSRANLIKQLDSSDPIARYRAVIDLAEMTEHPEWSTPIDMFFRDEANYLDQWKTWWREESK